MLVILLLMQQAFAQRAKFRHLFTLKGQLYGAHADSVFLYYKNLEGNPIFQSQLIFNDKFIFSDSVDRPLKAMLVFKNLEDGQEKASDMKGKEFFIEHGLLTIEGNPTKLDELVVIGSNTQDEADSLNTEIASIRTEMKPLVDAYNKEKDPEKAAILNTKLEPYEDRIKSISYRFFLGHPNSYLTADQMVDYVMKVSLDSSRTIYKHFNAELKDTEEGKKIAAEIKKMEAVLPGNMAADFTTKDVDGRAIALNDYLGKYVLLDFWASWCAPCRAGNPHLIELYNRYKEKGLNVIGIAADDDTQDAWRQAIARDCLDGWPNVLSGAETDNDIGDKYAIHFVPTRILIDPTGKIIGRFGDNNASDVLMDRMLASIFTGKK